VVSSSSNENNHQQLKTKRKRSPSGVSRAGRGVRTSWSWGQGKEEPKSWKHTNEGEKKIKKKGKKKIKRGNPEEPPSPARVSGAGLQRGSREGRGRRHHRGGQPALARCGSAGRLSSAGARGLAPPAPQPPRGSLPAPPAG